MVTHDAEHLAYLGKEDFKDKKDKLSPIKTAESLQESELKYESDTKDSEIHRLMTEIAEVKVSII